PRRSRGIPWHFPAPGRRSRTGSPGARNRVPLVYDEGRGRPAGSGWTRSSEASMKKACVLVLVVLLLLPTLALPADAAGRGWHGGGGGGWRGAAWSGGHGGGGWRGGGHGGWNRSAWHGGHGGWHGGGWHGHHHHGGCCWGWGGFAVGVGIGAVLTSPW